MSMELKQELAFTKEELAELEAAKKMPITFDERKEWIYWMIPCF